MSTKDHMQPAVSPCMYILLPSKWEAPVIQLGSRVATVTAQWAVELFTNVSTEASLRGA